MHLKSGSAFAMLDPQPPDPCDEARDLGRPVATRDDRAEVHERVSLGIPGAIPAPAAADRDLDLDHRLEPVDVGALEQADLDEAHGAARIATGAAVPTMLRPEVFP